MRYIDQVELNGKRVLLRADLNVPMDGGRVADDWRIRAELPTINYILENGGRLIIASHLGRPKGKAVPGLSLRPVADKLSELLGSEVAFVDDVIGPKAREAAERVPPGSAVMLENLRFHPGEETDSEELSREMASLADVYVDDAFANAHRAHASNVGVVEYALQSVGGFLMRSELEALGRVIGSPRRPLVAVVGGAKVESKIGVLERLAETVDALLLGGAMALPFLKAKGLSVGDSKLAESSPHQALTILEKAERGGVRLVLPVDLVVAEEGSDRVEVVPASNVPPGKVPLDIGPETARLFKGEIMFAGTVIWNGPLGAFEKEQFSMGTRAVGEAMAGSSAFTLAGGGDTALALRRYGLTNRISYVSTGGGAFLEFLAGKDLPAVRALEEAEITVIAPNPT